MLFLSAIILICHPPYAQLEERAPAIRSMQSSVVQLDIVAARAAHARIFGAVMPLLLPPPGSESHESHESSVGEVLSGEVREKGSQEGDLPGTEHPGQGRSYVWVPGALHPLLLERSLPEPLPDPPSVSTWCQ